MSIGDWIGVASLVLVVPLGITSGLLTPRVVAYLERRKLLKTHRTKTQALIAYKRIEDFKSGKRNRYPSYILLAVGAVICFVAFVTLFLLIDFKYARFFEGSFIPTPATLNLSVIAFGFFIFSIVCIIVITTTARRLEQFDK